MIVGNPPNNQSGFTLVELLVAVGVGALASVLIVFAFVNVYGNIIREQTRTQMTRQSQLFLRRMTDDIREAQVIRTTNTIADAHMTAGWVTSDPANILVTTTSATDSSKALIYDATTGYPYQHEVIYFGDNDKMYRRLLVNPNAVGANQQTTCPAGTTGCTADAELVDNLENMLFTFYDIDGAVTTVPDDARSVEVTINLSKQVYGEEIEVTNVARMTLRNEN